MSASAARRLTDEQLRTAQLVVANPLELEGVTSEAPDKSCTPVVIAEYHLEAGQPQVRCSYCDQRQPHQHGFVVEFRAPAKHLVGSVCGPAKLDLHFAAAKRSHSELLARQRQLQRLDTLVNRRAELIAACDEVLFGDPLKALEAKASELAKVAGDTVIRLRALSRSSGQLTESIRVRDLEAERQRDQHREEGKEGGPIYRYDEAPIGPLRGRAVVDADRLRRRVHAYKQALDGLATLARQDTDQIPTTKLNRALSEIERCREDANEAVIALNAAPAFFDPGHVHLLARWASGAAKGVLSEDGGKLRAGPLVVEALPSWTVPQLPPLA